MAIVFGLENPTFLVKSHIFIPKCTEGEEGFTGLGIIPKEYQFFLLLPLAQLWPHIFLDPAVYPLQARGRNIFELSIQELKYTNRRERFIANIVLLDQCLTTT